MKKTGGGEHKETCMNAKANHESGSKRNCAVEKIEQR